MGKDKPPLLRWFQAFAWLLLKWPSQKGRGEHLICWPFAFLLAKKKKQNNKRHLQPSRKAQEVLGTSPVSSFQPKGCDHRCRFWLFWSKNRWRFLVDPSNRTPMGAMFFQADGFGTDENRAPSSSGRAGAHLAAGVGLRAAAGGRGGARGPVALCLPGAPGQGGEGWGWGAEGEGWGGGVASGVGSGVRDGVGDGVGVLGVRSAACSKPISVEGEGDPNSQPCMALGGSFSFPRL